VDPNATYALYLDALAAGDPAGAAQAAHDLALWMHGGGFVPEALKEASGLTGGEMLGEYFRKTAAALRWAANTRAVLARGQEKRS
jgi:hypothetical protein